jgi:hypothetical protein
MLPHLQADHALHLALEGMSAARLDLLPVVSRTERPQVGGVVTLHDVLDSVQPNRPSIRSETRLWGTASVQIRLTQYRLWRFFHAPWRIALWS